VTWRRRVYLGRRQRQICSARRRWKCCIPFALAGKSVMSGTIQKPAKKKLYRRYEALLRVRKSSFQFESTRNLKAPSHSSCARLLKFYVMGVRRLRTRRPMRCPSTVRTARPGDPTMFPNCDGRKEEKEEGRRKPSSGGCPASTAVGNPSLEHETRCPAVS